MANYKNLDTSKLNYIIYCRKSSEGEDRQIQSLDTQLRELTEHAERNKLNVVEVISESKSAFKVGRDGFDRMMALIKSGKADAVLVVRANRISRNPIDAGYVVSLMDENKLLYIRTPNSTCYTSSSTDKMMIGLELIFSKKDSDDKGDMVKEGQKSKALKGTPHGVSALGFLNDRTEEKGNRSWMVDEERLWKIEKLLKMFLTGTWSAGKLHKYAVTELKLTTVKRKKSGGELIALSRIYEILVDPIYAGFFLYNKERYTLDKKLPRLITEAQHNKIKQLLSRNNVPKAQHHEAVYSGFIKSVEGNFMGQDIKFQVICDCKNKFSYRSKTNCPKCGIEISTMDSPKYLTNSYYYNVKKKKSGGKYKSIAESVITEKLVTFIGSNLHFSDDLVAWSKKYIHEMKDKEVVEKVLLARDKEARKQEYEMKKSKLRGMLRDDRFTDEEYKTDLQLLTEEYTDVTTTESSDTDWYEEMLSIVDLTQGIVEIFQQDGLFQYKRELLSKLGSNLVWNDEELNIYNKKSVTTLIEGVKRIKSEIPKFEPKLSFMEQGLNEKTEPFHPVFSMMLPG